MKPAVSWPGGKSRLLKHLLPLIPEHYCYCEVFGGGMALLLAKQRSPLEIINDINGDLVTFYRCVRFHPDALLTELEFVLSSRQEFVDFREQPGLTDIQRAARWYFRNKTCFGGSDMSSFGTRAVSGGGSRAARLESIRALNHRLDRVTVENLDWTRCISIYDRPTTFFFFDPPYTGCDIDAYKSWTETDVRKLRDTLDALKGKWLVTLNDTAAVRRIFEGCTIKAVTRKRAIRVTAGVPASDYREIIITPFL